MTPARCASSSSRQGDARTDYVNARIRRRPKRKTSSESAGVDKPIVVEIGAINLRRLLVLGFFR